MASSRVNAIDILDRIFRGVVGTGHCESWFHSPIFLEISSRTCSKFANFEKSNRAQIRGPELRFEFDSIRRNSPTSNS